MRSLLLLLLLVCAGCHTPDRYYVFASNLTRPSKVQLMVWPDDEHGHRFRALVQKSEEVPREIAPLLDEEHPATEDFGCLVVLLPDAASAALDERCASLLARLRGDHPSASFHYVRLPIDLSEIDHAHLLLKKLRASGGGTRRFTDWFFGSPTRVIDYPNEN